MNWNQLSCSIIKRFFYVWIRSLGNYFNIIIVLIIFGAGKLPKVAGELAKGIKSFKQGLKDEKKNDNKKN